MARDNVPDDGKIALFEPIFASFVAGSATAIGGLIVFFLKRAPNDRQVSLSLSFAAGVMIAVSVLDLWLPSSSKRPLLTALCGAFGFFFCVVLSKLPIPGAEQLLLQAHTKLLGMNSTSSSGSNIGPELIAATATDVELATTSLSTPQRQRGATSAGASLTPSAASALDDSKSLLQRGGQHLSRTGSLMRLGVLLALVLSAHNLPEGIAVLASSAKSHSLGWIVAASIFTHNVAEGLCVAIPIFTATGNRCLALTMTAASGMTEPLGALIAGLLFNRYGGAAAGGGIDPTVVDAVLSAVGGVMVSVSFSELVPSALAFAKGERLFVGQGMACGAVLIALSLLAL